MAIHGGLGRDKSQKPKLGYLASVREVKYRLERLDLLESDLIVNAELIMGDEQRVVYQFSITCNGAEILSGRAAVVLEIVSE